MAGTFSVPARRLRSCLPPVIVDSRRVPRRIHSAPTPFGPYSLCPERLSRSTSSAVDVDGHLADGLHRIGVHDDAAGVRQRGAGGDGLQRADLVVGVHQAEQRRVVGEGRGDRLGLHDAVPIRRDARDAPAAALEGTHRGEHGFVLDAAGDEVALAERFERLGDAAQREVVGLGAAAREDDFGGGAADERGDVLTGVVESGLGALAEMVHAGGVAEVVAHGVGHGGNHVGIDGRGRVVVEIDARASGRHRRIVSPAASRKPQQLHGLDTICPLAYTPPDVGRRHPADPVGRSQHVETR